MLDISTGLGLINFEQDEKLAQSEQLTFPEEIKEVLPSYPFYIFIAISTYAKIHMQRHMVIDQSNIILSTIIDREVAYQKSLLDN